MLPDRISKAFAELRMDVGGVRRSRFRAGVGLTIAGFLAPMAAWVSGSLGNFFAQLILLGVPMVVTGWGIVAHELARSRAERQSRLQADQRDTDAIRRAIAEGRAE